MSDEPSTPPWTEVAGSGSGDASDPTDPDAADSPAERVRVADGLLVLSDFDGTLADVQPRPEQARIRPEARDALASLADQPQTAVAVVSGRTLTDVRERVGLNGVAYAGNHGFEIEAADREFVHPEVEGAAATTASVCADLGDRLADVEGAIVEEKDISATVHYRQVPAEDVDRVRAAVGQAVAEYDGRSSRDGAGAGEADGEAGLRIDEGKEIFELKPAVDWDKGRAVEWLRDVMIPDGATWHPIYVGDDVTDEDAFRALVGTGTTVRVGPPDEPTAADYRLDSPGDVAALFEWLEDLRDRDGGPNP